MKKPHIEYTTVQFKIIVNGENQGIFELKIRHNTDTNSSTYKQKNSMTSVSWGNAKSVIAKEELIDKTVKLYKSTSSDSQFVLVFE